MTSMRQLAAIMFTDIVGYTALMGENENRALELLQTNRKLQRPLIEKHHGRWLKEIGDGVLASFNTVSDAVYCAIDIQKACESETDLNLRIGIHLGEVVFEGEDVFGDGVNIASRLEALAPTGGIWISDSVNRNIKNKQGMETRFIKEEQLKNVKDPVRIYEVSVEGGYPSEVIKSKTSLPTKTKKALSLSRKLVAGLIAIFVVALALTYFLYPFQGDNVAVDGPRTIAVLAFDDQSPEGDQEWLGDGMADEILNVLAKVNGLQMTGKTSSFSFKGKDVTIPEIGEALKVNTILQGSVSKVGDRLRITAQLVDVKSDKHIWSDKYDRDASEIFDIIDEVAQSIAGSLMSELSIEDAKNIRMVYKPDPEAYKYFVLAENTYLDEYQSAYDYEIFLEIKELYQKAIEIDPEYMDALAGLANIYYEYCEYGSGIEKDFLKADSILNVAYQKDPSSPYVLYLKGWRKRNENLDSAFSFLSEAYKINPFHTAAINLPAVCFTSGFYDLAIDLCRKYLADDPLNKIYRTLLIRSLFAFGHVEEARYQTSNHLEFDANNFWGNQYLLYFTLYVDRNIPKAKKLVDKLNRIDTISFYIRQREAQLLAAEGKKDLALKKAPNDLSVKLLLDTQEKALAQMDSIFNLPNFSYTGYWGYLSLKGHPSFAKIREEPQFQEWLQEAQAVHEERVRKYYNLFDD